MKYKVVKKVNPQNPDGPKKKHANPVNAGKMLLKHLAKEISARSSLTVGDIENVLYNLLDVLPLFLKIGMSVQLGDFGTLRLTLVSESVNEDEEFTVAKIKGVRVVFTPSKELKNALKDITFEEQKSN
jgi:predicted histone-like DNA-binding protein